MLVGALLGAAHGASRIPDKLKSGLVARAAITREVKTFLSVVQKADSNAAPRAPRKTKRLSVSGEDAKAGLPTSESTGERKDLESSKPSKPLEISTVPSEPQPSGSKTTLCDMPFLPEESADVRQPPPAQLMVIPRIAQPTSKNSHRQE